MADPVVTPEEGLVILEQRLKRKGVRIRHHRESWWGTLIGRLAYMIFGEHFPSKPDVYGWIIVQTVGRTIWLPNNWNTAEARIKFEILLHEERHVEQYRKWGLGSMNLGVLTMGSLYILCLPIFWTMRSRFEAEAYFESIRARFLIGDPPGEGFLKHMIDAFTTRKYVWMRGPWARKEIESWFWRACVQAQRQAKIV